MYNPRQLICVRHGQSQLNAMHSAKRQDPEYRRFIKLFKEDPDDPEVLILAKKIKEKYVHETADHASPITLLGRLQAVRTGEELKELVKEVPSAVFVSSYLRARESFEAMKTGWPELENIKDIFYEDDLREQDIGVATLYGDFEAFWALNPEQKKLREQEGDYFYKFPSGENLADLRFRVRPFLEKIKQLYNDKNVLVISHAQTLLAIKAEIEKWDVNEYLKHRTNSDLINFALSIYEKVPSGQKQGKLKSVMYNRQLWQ